uniref:NADH-ubiquinone oxidoreductase chain 3 n=1 Tax=Stylosomus rugithorax TaxID=1425630 RepID=A0A3G1GQ41_9CUCU|nr:NADH dehydrogenase subunit 3 [Stylosomus rugithorax]
MLIITFSWIIVILLIILTIILNLISMKTFIDREKSSPFECGFDPKTSPRIPFSLQFFLIAVIFLVFDVELALLFPLIKVMPMSNLITYTFLSVIFIGILLMGLFHEWKQGALKWAC